MRPDDLTPVPEPLDATPSSIETARRSAADFRRVVDAAPDAVSILTDNVFVYANPVLVSLLGYRSMSEVVGKPLPAFVHPDELPILRERAALVLSVAGPVGPREYRLVHRAGHQVCVEVTSIAIEYGGKTSILSFGRDMTEHRRLEAELLQAAKMAAVGTMAASVGHELNNPLAYVMLGLETLSRDVSKLVGDPALLPDFQQRLDEVRHGAERVRNIVRDLRAFSRPDDDERGPVDVGRALAAALAMTANEVHHKANLVTRIDPLPSVAGSATRVEQIFVNLLLNAAQALPEGSGNHEIRVRAGVREGRVAVEVGDTGPGIPPEHRDRIFDPFFSTKSAGQGTGLGLSICDRIVASLGGTLTFESRPGDTVFTVSLPASGEAARAVTPARAEPARTNARRVLLIDDEPLIVGMLASMLRAESHDVAVAGSGKEGLTILTGDRGFDLVLCDMMMPGLTGMDLWEEVRRAYPGFERRIVLMTGGAFTPRASRFLAESGARSLDKPFGLETIQDLLRRGIE